MKIQLRNKDGEFTKTLTQKEIDDKAILGDKQCIFNKKLKAEVNVENKIKLILEYLGLD